MSNQEPISLRQLTVLTTLYVIGDSILVLPAFPAQIAKQDAWLSGLLGTAVGIPLFFICFALARVFPNQTLFEYVREMIGRWLGFIVSALYLYYFFLMTISLAREVGDFMTTQMIPDTPIQSIIILYLAIVVFAVRLGVNTIARTAELLFFAVFFLFFILTVSILPQTHSENIFPLGEYGFKPIALGAITTATFPYEFAPFFLLFPQVKRLNGVRGSILRGALLGGMVINIIVILTILVLNHILTGAQIYPSYSLAKKIDIAKFLTRLEAMIAVMWFITIFIKTCINFYALSVGLQQMLRLDHHRGVTLPIGMIILVYAVASAPNITYYNEVIGNYWPFFDFTFGFVIPLLLYIVYSVRKKWKSAKL